MDHPLSTFLCTPADIAPGGCEDTQPCICVTIQAVMTERAEMLAALKGLVALNRTPDRYASPALLAARAVIAKAEAV